MKRNLITLAFAAMALFLSFPTGARATDGSDSMEIKVTAPLEAVSCDTVPPTVTVLGLPIDITAALIEVRAPCDDGDDEDCEENDGEVEGDRASQQVSGGDDQGENDDDQGEDGDNECVNPPATCADLLVGRSVEVTLAGDLAPFVATKVSQKEDDGDVEIQAPIQAVDPVLHTITLLGLVVDISTARIEGSNDDEGDDDDGEGEMENMLPTELIVGQFVEVELDPRLLPLLVATEIEVKNAANQCEVEVMGPDGQEVDDAEDTVQVDVEQTVTLAAAATGVKSKAKGQRRTLHFQAHSNGRTVLSGLGTGRARITVKRVKDGATSTGRGAITVVPNTKSTAVIRLKGSSKKK